MKIQRTQTKWVTLFLIFVACIVSPAQTSKIIYKDSQGKLNYVSDKEGNRIPDFSFAGYKSGEIAIPNVSVVKTISPISGDNRAHIQAAIDEVSTMPMINGIRGALLLQNGTYEVVGTIYIRNSGVILRGEGNGTDPNSDTIIFSPEKQSQNNTTIIKVEGAAKSGRYKSIVDKIANTESFITNEFLPVNSRCFDVDNISLYSVGDLVCVSRKPKNKWLQLINFGDTDSDGPWKISDDFEMVYPRKVVAINGVTLILDQPIYEHIFNNDITTSSIYKLNTGNNRFISNVGIEKLRISAGYNSNNLTDNFSAKVCLQFDGVWDSWATNIVTENFNFTGFNMRTVNRITLEYCEALDPISEITGGFRYNFNMDAGANNVLVKNAVATQGRHSYVSNGTASVSGIVFTQSSSSGDYAAMEGHRRWSQGLLYDQITITNSNNLRVLGLYNRGRYGGGHGWSAAHSVVWNSSSDSRKIFLVQKPPTAQNYAMYNNATVSGNGPFNHEAGYFEGNGESAPFASLYEAQLLDRLANGVLIDPPAKVKAIEKNGNLTISWIDNSGEEDNYVIEISLDGGTTYKTLTTEASDTEIYVTPINNSNYNFFDANFQMYSIKNGNKSSRRYFKIEHATTTLNYQVIKDAYTQSVNNADDNFGSATTILLKTSPSLASSTSRKGYLQFDLSNISEPKEIQKVFLNFEVSLSKKTLGFNVYEIADDWEENSITYNNAPSLGNVVSSFSTNGTSVGEFSLNITNHVKTSIAAGDKIISFAFYDDDFDDDFIRIYSKENTVGGKVATLQVQIKNTQILSAEETNLFKTKYTVRQYPNPTKDNVVFFEFKLYDSSPLNLSIIDLNGRIIKTVKRDLNSGNQKIKITENLKDGMYIYKLKTNEFAKSIKVIVSNYLK